MGRWQKGRDLTWYAKDHNKQSQEDVRREELAAIKAREAEAMAIALCVRRPLPLRAC